jgi:inorganic triphosphatase YgiF
MEVEAKLAADRSAILAAIARRKRLGPYELRAVGERALETVYLDTGKRDLLRRGIGLRLRKTSHGAELTLKLPGAVASAVHRRPESTWHLRRMPTLPLRLRPREFRDRLCRWTGNRELVPLIGTRIRRRALLVRRRAGAAPIAEIDLDRVEFFHPGQAVAAGGRFYEVEVELLGGDDSDLERLVQALRRRYALRPSRLSKLERALRWAGIPTLRSRRRR